MAVTVCIVGVCESESKMAPQDVYHNSEDQQQIACVISAAKPRGLPGLIKTLSFALTTDAISVSLDVSH